MQVYCVNTQASLFTTDKLFRKQFFNQFQMDFESLFENNKAVLELLEKELSTSVHEEKQLIQLEMEDLK